MPTKPSGPSSERFRPGDICRVCGWRRRRPGCRECPECIARASTEQAREEARTRARRTERGNKWSSRPGECSRCTRSVLPGRDVCREHAETLAEIRRERTG